MDTEMSSPTRGSLVALSGAAGSGKSLLASALVERGWKRVKFAGPLKAMLAAYYDHLMVPEAEIEERLEGRLKELPDPLLGGASPRFAMQTLGTEWGRATIASDIWVDAWATRASLILSSGANVVVDDLRFPNELLKVHSLGGLAIRVLRPGLPVPLHQSETMDFRCDEVIHNDGSKEQLVARLWEIVE